MKPPFYTVTACGARTRALDSSPRREHALLPLLPPREVAVNPPGRQRVPRAVVTRHPERPQEDVLHTRPNAALTQPPEVQVLMSPFAYAQFDRGLDPALCER